MNNVAAEVTRMISKDKPVYYLSDNLVGVLSGDIDDKGVFRLKNENVVMILEKECNEMIKARNNALQAHLSLDKTIM